MGKNVVVSQTHQQGDKFIAILVMAHLQMLDQEAAGDVAEVEVEVEAEVVVVVVVVGWILFLGMQQKARVALGVHLKQDYLWTLCDCSTMIMAVNLLPHHLYSTTIKTLLHLHPAFREQTNLKTRHLENITGVATVCTMYTSELA